MAGVSQDELDNIYIYIYYCTCLLNFTKRRSTIGHPIHDIISLQSELGYEVMPEEPAPPACRTPLYMWGSATSLV